MRTRLTTVKFLAAGLIIAVFTVAGPSTALATTATDSQNPDLRVSVSLTSNNAADPNQAAVGDTVTMALAVRNNTFNFQEVKVALTLVIPDGRSFSSSFTIFLAPFQTLAPKVEFTVNELFPTGPYSLTLAASNAKGTSSATATITII